MRCGRSMAQARPWPRKWRSRMAECNLARMVLPVAIDPIGTGCASFVCDCRTGGGANLLHLVFKHWTLFNPLNVYWFQYKTAKCSHARLIVLAAGNVTRVTLRIFAHSDSLQFAVTPFLAFAANAICNALFHHLKCLLLYDQWAMIIWFMIPQWGRGNAPDTMPQVEERPSAYTQVVQLPVDLRLIWDRPLLDSATHHRQNWISRMLVTPSGTVSNNVVAH